MSEIKIKQLMKAQQGEMDAVLLYRRLAELVKDESFKKQFQQVAADEGKHASILKDYTNVVLKPKAGKARLISTLYRIAGKRFTMRLLANGEMKSIESYGPLVKDYPRIQEIMDDEKRHSDIATAFLNSSLQ